MQMKQEILLEMEAVNGPEGTLVSIRESLGGRWQGRVDDPCSGLDALRFEDLRGGQRLMEALAAKLNRLDTCRFTDRELERSVRKLLDVVRETVAGRYPHLSLRGMIRILGALDHFLEVEDEIPDTWMNGYEDDARHVEQVCRDLNGELAAFDRWRARQGDRC